MTGKDEASTDVQMTTVGLLPVTIKAKNSLDEFVELVRQYQKEHNAAEEMSIVATVVFTIRDLH